MWCYFDRVSRREHGDPQIEELNIGEAAEPEGRGTGEHGRKDSCHTALLKVISSTTPDLLC